jgi:hypothetical protein
VLLRFRVEYPALQRVPWEALYEPYWDRDFHSLSDKLLPVRAVVDKLRPAAPREVDGGIRVLLLFPGEARETAICALRGADDGRGSSG